MHAVHLYEPTLLLLFGVVCIDEIGIMSVGCQEILVRSLFFDSTIFDENDLIALIQILKQHQNKFITGKPFINMQFVTMMFSYVLANLVLIVSVVHIFCQIVFHIFMQVFESLCQIYVIHVNICYHYLFWLWAVIKAYIWLSRV